MAKENANPQMAAEKIPAAVLETIPLWQLDIAELTGHNLETRGREDVNKLLRSGWRLLHIYTLKYQEGGVWRERPMAILGRLRNASNDFHLE
jgi:FtsZ-binding cell division protein ZapB